MPASPTRIVLAAFCAAVAWFLWGMVAHMVLSLGESSFRRLPDEAAVTAALAGTTPDDGMYTFPMLADGPNGEEASMDQYAEAYRKGPVGILIYRRTVAEMMPPSTLLKEFGAGFAASLVAALVLSRIGWGPFAAARAAGLAALACWLSNDLSLWIWYGYPWSWVTSTLIEQVVGWSIAGAVIAFVVHRGAAARA